MTPAITAAMCRRGTKAVIDLMLAYQMNPHLFTDAIGIPESGNGVADILDEARVELEWLLKMQNGWGGVYDKVVTAQFPDFIMPIKTRLRSISCRK